MQIVQSCRAQYGLCRPIIWLDRLYRPTCRPIKTGISLYMQYLGKAHQKCIIGQKFCLHNITGTAFIIRLKLYVYIVENSETFQKIYSFIQFKSANFVSLMPIAYQIGKKWSIWPVSEPPLDVPACCMGKVLIIIKLFKLRKRRTG